MGDKSDQNIIDKSMRSVFVGNIPYEVTEDMLRDIFSVVGPVISLKMVFDRESGKSKGFGFCEYKDQETALSAMRNLNGYEISGRNLRVDNACTEKSRMEMQQLMMGSPIEKPYGPSCHPDEAAEVITKRVTSMPPEQIFELMRQTQRSIVENPNETRQMLLLNPQLAFALLQAMVVMRILEPETAVGMLYKPNEMPPVLGGNMTTNSANTGRPMPLPEFALDGPSTSAAAAAAASSSSSTSLAASSAKKATAKAVSFGDVDMRSFPGAPNGSGAPRKVDQDLRLLLNSKKQANSWNNLQQQLQHQQQIQHQRQIQQQQLQHHHKMQLQQHLQMQLQQHLQMRQHQIQLRQAPNQPGNRSIRPYYPRDPSQFGVNPRQYGVNSRFHAIRPQQQPRPVLIQPRLIQQQPMPLMAHQPQLPQPQLPSPQLVQQQPIAPLALRAELTVNATEQEKAAVIMQVLQLTETQLAQLPQQQRESIEGLKEQIAKNARRQ